MVRIHGVDVTYDMVGWGEVVHIRSKDGRGLVGQGGGKMYGCQWETRAWMGRIMTYYVNI